MKIPALTVGLGAIAVAAVASIGTNAAATTPPPPPPTDPPPTTAVAPPTVFVPPTGVPPTVAIPDTDERPVVAVGVVACDDGTGSGVVQITLTNPADGGPTRPYRVTTFVYYEDFEVADGHSASVTDRGYRAGSYVTQGSDLVTGARTTTSFDVPQCPAPTTTISTTTTSTSATDTPDGSTEGSAVESEGSLVTIEEAGAADSSVSVRAFADPETPLGESTLRRTDDGLLITFDSTGWAPGHAVTLWWVVFNQPANCSPPGCDLDDVYIGGDPAAGLDTVAIANVDVVAAYATGTIVDTDGTVTMASRLAVGDPGADVIFGDGPLLDDDAAAAAEVHLVARSHGPTIEGQTFDQLTSHAGGCTNLLNPPAQAETEGDCVDTHFAIHRAST